MEKSDVAATCPVENGRESTSMNGISGFLREGAIPLSPFRKGGGCLS